MRATFNMWSEFHFFMIFFPFILAFILYLIFRKKSEKLQQWAAIILSIMMVIVIIARSIYMVHSKGGLNPEAIPLQICHLANFVMLAASLKKSKVIGAIAWCFNFPAGLVSLIFANSLTHYENILNIQGLAYIIGHMLIVTGGLYMLLIGMIEINRKILVNSYKIIFIFYLLSIFINNWFNKIFAKTNVDANYFYTYKPEEGTPLQVFFDLGHNSNVLGITFNIAYLILDILLGFLVIFIFYIIYLFTKRIQSKKSYQ